MLMFRSFVFALVVVVVTGCTPEEPPIPVVVGSKDTTEQRILGEILAQLVESEGMVAERRLGLGGTTECDEALRAGRIDMYPEYSGLALILILRAPSATSLLAQGPEAVLQRVRTEYAQSGLEWTAPFGFDNSPAIVVRGNTPGVTLSEVVPAMRNWRAAFPFDFHQRSDFYPALKKAYGLEFAEIKTVSPGDQYKLLTERQVDAVVGSVTDGMIAKLSLRALEDDKRVLPTFRAAPVVRRKALDEHPGLEDALYGLADMLDTATMRKMNEAVDVSGRTPADVAEEFLDNL